MAELEFTVIICKIKLESLRIVHLQLIHNCHIQHHMSKAWDFMSAKHGI